MKSFSPLLRRHAGAFSAALAVLVAQTVLNTVDPLVLRYTLDQGLAGRHAAAVWTGVAAYVILIAARTGGETLGILSGAALRSKLAMDLRLKTLRSMLAADLARLRGQKAGDLMARMTQDTQVIEDFLSDTLPRALLDLFTTIAYAAILLVLDWRLALPLLAFAPIQPLFLRVFGRGVKGAAERQKRAESELFAVTGQVCDGALTIRAFRSEEFFLGRFRAALGDFTAALARAQMVGLVGPSVLEVCIALVQFGVIIGLGSMLAFSGQTTVGTIMAFFMYSLRLVGPVVRIPRHLAKLKVAEVSAARLDEMVASVAFPKADTQAVQPGVQTAPPPAVWPNLQPAVQVRSLNYQYPGQESLALKDVSLTLEHGEKVALVGPNGSGKSTLGLLLAGLLVPPTGGAVTRNEDESHQTLYISGEPFLFPGTIRENLCLGATLGDEELLEAIQVVGALELVTSLDGGLDATVSENGANFSAGERQKLALARAILRRPHLFILDETTSSVDIASEQAFHRWLGAEPCTALVISHKESSLRWVQRAFHLGPNNSD